MRRCLVLLLALLLAVGISACDAGVINSIDDLSYSNIGFVSGTATSNILPLILPEANFIEFNSVDAEAMALMKGDIDAFATDEAYYYGMLWDSKKVDKITEAVSESEYGFVFNKEDDSKLREEFNDFIEKIKNDAEIEYLEKKWFSRKEPNDYLDYSTLDDKNGTIVVGICSTTKPFVYEKRGQYVGFDVEILTMFALEYGYALEFKDTVFRDVIDGVEDGRYQIGACGLSINDARKDRVDFSVPYHTGDLVLIVRD